MYHYYKIHKKDKRKINVCKDLKKINKKKLQ